MISESKSEYEGLTETLKLLSQPGMREKLIEGMNTLLEDCIPEDKVDWEKCKANS